MPSRWHHGDSNPLNLTPPSSEDEETYQPPRRHAAPSSRRRALPGDDGTFDGHMAAISRSDSRYSDDSRSHRSRGHTYSPSPTGLRRAAAINSASQSPSRRARGHSSNHRSTERDRSGASYRSYDREVPRSALRHMDSFELGPDILNRRLRRQESRAFEPGYGTDLSAYDSSYSSYGSSHGSSNSSLESHMASVGLSPRRSGSTRRDRSDFHDISSASGMPESLNSHGLSRRHGRYFGDASDLEEVRQGSRRCQLIDAFSYLHSDDNHY